MDDFIIEKPSYHRNRLSSKVSTSKQMEKYIRERELFIEFDVDINIDESILNIPLTATVLPLAWITGSDLYVETIDLTFKESMGELQKFFSNMFPNIPFTTEIKADELVRNKIEPENPANRTGLLFSGGVDSFYSLVNNFHFNPKLIMLWGVDDFSYPERADHWEKTISIYREYAERKNLELYILKTNISQILNAPQIDHTYYKELYYGSIRSTLGHSTELLGPAAPISIGRFDQLIIAATNTLEYDYQLMPNGAHPDADEKIIWADLSVKHDGLVIRSAKINQILDFHSAEKFTLRVCSSSTFIDGRVNCGKCEKCLNTIAELILAGYDPNKCGFQADKSFFKFLKSIFEDKKWASRYARFWRGIKDSIPTQIDFDVPGANDFFEWFRDYDLDSMIKEFNWFYTDLYMWLPFRLANVLEKIYEKSGISIQRWPYNRSYALTLNQHSRAEYQ